MKKFLYAIVIGVLTGLVGSGLYAYVTKQKRPVVSTTTQQTNTSLSSAKLLVWDDPAGFTFQYPEGLSVNKHDEDSENYAHIELTDKNHSGRVVVWAKDIPKGVSTIDQWVKKQKEFSGVSVIDTTFLGSPAKKIFLTKPRNTVRIAAIADDLLIIVEADLDDEFWSGAHDTIVRTLQLKPAEESLSGSGESESTGELGEFGDEEIVE